MCMRFRVQNILISSLASVVIALPALAHTSDVVRATSHLVLVGVVFFVLTFPWYYWGIDKIVSPVRRVLVWPATYIVFVIAVVAFFLIADASNSDLLLALPVGLTPVLQTVVSKIIMQRPTWLRTVLVVLGANVVSLLILSVLDVFLLSYWF